MSIKPSVVYIKGVHSITGHDQSSDIGFPQLELEKLFEGAALKQIDSGTNYDSNKKYIYKNETSSIAIQDEGHFNCIKNGYYSIDNNISHYYILSGSDYSYNTVPDTSTWAGKWALSNAINGKELYSIDSEADRIYIDDNYYKKENNDYVKQTVKSYDLYKEGQQVLWDDNHKYERITSEIEDDEGFTDYITTWKKASDKTSATTGFYLLIDETIDTNGNQIYNVSLCNLTFDSNGVTSNNFTGFLYKLDTDNSFGSITWYIKNSNKLEKLIVNTDIVFNTNPVGTPNFYLYQNIGSYTYPNTMAVPESVSLYTDYGSPVYNNFNITNFPTYETAKKSVIPITPYGPYTIYEKTAIKINYNYSGDANSLKFIFTDKDIDGVITACGLPNDIKKYVHLTNLKYNEN